MDIIAIVIFTALISFVFKRADRKARAREVDFLQRIGAVHKCNYCGNEIPTHPLNDQRTCMYCGYPFQSTCLNSVKKRVPDEKH